MDAVEGFTSIPFEVVKTRNAQKQISTARGLYAAALIKYGKMEFVDVCDLIGRTQNAIATIITRVRKEPEWSGLEKLLKELMIESN